MNPSIMDSSSHLSSVFNPHQNPSRLSSHHRSSTTLRPPNPNKKYERSTRPRHSLSQLFLFTICLSSFVSLTTATKYLPIAEQLIERSSFLMGGVETSAESLESTFARLARSGTIIVDRRAPPVPKNWESDSDNSDGADLRRRSASSSSTSSSANAKTVSTGTVVPSSTSTGGIVAATTTAMASLPIPFDTGFNNNITTSCATFMNSMLSNSTFKSCLPFSLLLQNSNSFFQASKSLVRITQTLDYSCSANFTLCTSLLSSFATALPLPANCLSDLTASNPSIKQAHLGLLAYPTLYSASCLRNPTTSSYCFADAITNASNPSDPAVYFLPLNTSFVGGTQPTCDACLKNSMAIFEAATAEKGAAIRDTYGSAARQVNVFCGPEFVNASLAAVAVASSAGPGVAVGGTGVGVWIWTWVVGAMVLSWLL